MYIFLSHSSTDANIANALCSHIEANGHQCFIAPRDIRTGFEYASELINGIDKSNAMILLLSNEAAKSPHVLREIERAVSKSIPIIVYKLEEVVLSKSLEYFLMTHQWMDAKHGNYMDVINCINGLQCASSPTATTIDVNTSANVNTATNIKATDPKIARRRFILPVVIFISAIIISIAIIAGTLILRNGNDNNSDDRTSGNIVADATTGDDITDDTTENKVTDDKETDDTETTDNSTINNDETTSNEENTSDEETTRDSTTEPVKFNIGDTITFGKYNDVAIQWRVLKLSDDGTEAILITDDIITMKGFDAADTGRYGYYNGEGQYSKDSIAHKDMKVQADVWGNSNWELSSIRTWLNSSSKYVEYKDHTPNANSFSDNVNAYDLEAGFLYNFTEDERGAILEKDITTKANILVDADTITTKDKVFLLSVDELEWFKDTTISLFAKPSAEAIAQNEGTWYKDYCLDTYKIDQLMWWLREPVDGCSSKCYMVNIEIADTDTTDFYTVGVEEFGIRPAITVDLTNKIFSK